MPNGCLIETFPPPGLTTTGTAGGATRILLAFLTAFTVSFLVGRPLIRLLKHLGARERTEKTPIDDPSLRQRISSKSGTPTMGGLILLAGILGGCLLWTDMASPHVNLCLCSTFTLALVGLADDWMKLHHKGHRSGGLKPRHKLMAQAIVGGVAALALSRMGTGHWTLPIAKAGLLLPGALIVPAYVAWGMLVVGTMSNATNVTDGLDGLLAGLAAMTSAAMAVGCWAVGNPYSAASLGLSHAPETIEVGIFCGSLAGACLGFLWYNRHPARAFMGDTGALSIGSGLAVAALTTRLEPLLAVCGLVFLVEFGSSLLQIAFFHATGGRRLLPVAPLHHILEKRGDAEPSIVRRFYLGGALCTVAGLNLLWL